MDPKLKEQIFIRKHKGGIITVIILALILPMLLIYPQTTTQYRQQAAEISTTNPKTGSAGQSGINQALGENQKEYAAFLKCFNKSTQSTSCSPEERKDADLNSDGVINGIDYNLFIRKKSGQE